MPVRYKFIVLLLCCIAFISCTCNRGGHQPKKEKEINALQVNVSIICFEKALYSCAPDDIENCLANLQQQYPVFYNVFYNQVLNIPSVGDKKMQMQVMQDFITKKAMKELYDSVEQKFNSLDFLTNYLR